MKNRSRRKIVAVVLVICCAIAIYKLVGVNPEGKWNCYKYEGNPVLGGGELGTIFDISVLKDSGEYKMYCSWRPERSVALATSSDGINWSKPEIVLPPNEDSGWENDINRPVVVKRDSLYHMWYTGQKDGRSWIGYATSTDGRNFERQSADPVLSAEEDWEKVAVMCPHVIWDETDSIFKMWYSAGEQYEPDAIGYATSRDGLNWEKYTGNPVFKANPEKRWEKHKVTACQVIRREKDYLMFYIGFHDINYAQIGMARSRDGITDWQEYEHNPIITPEWRKWDASATYKPFAIREDDHWKLWYNGRDGALERIGLVIYPQSNIDF